ncbi:hypothetical protein GWK76_02750 [Candidatus Saccharibacteria bacterium oral taxon 488]|jgi:hypothetical protein|nr:hypothetical protein GWK76_02750 [Candidatus Saccharibacteria bacterium oral taxon 488]
MNKDVIYIDVEDDITAIVGKIKASKERIIALVPPKRVGVLRSAVNMRLIARTAASVNKRVVLITGDTILSGLAAAAKIPVAKTLQSKPEMAEVPVLKVDDENDVIDGRELPVGELEKSAQPVDETDKAIDSAIADSSKKQDDETSKPADNANKSKTAPKVPNFNLFRKKFLLIGGGALLLIGFLVWAIWFAPHARVIITAKTTTVTVNKKVTLRTDGVTDPTADVIKARQQEQKVELSVEFSATGKKKVGERAKGKLRIATDSISLLDKTVPAGTSIRTSGGMTFTTDSAVTFSRSNASGSTVMVTAANIGAEYNGESGSVSGMPSGVNAALVGETSGGSSREVTVVSSDDVKRASDLLNEKKADSLRAKVEQSFGGSTTIIKGSYQEQRSTPTPSVAVDSEATGAVTLKTVVTASMVGIEKSELSTYLKATANKELEGKQSQKIYKDGVDSAQFAQFSGRGGNFIAHITANAVVGPTIDEEKVKEQSRGKSYGDIQSALEAIKGIENVDVKFSPFWVRTVPNDTKRISIEFKLNES